MLKIPLIPRRSADTCTAACPCRWRRSASNIGRPVRSWRSEKHSEQSKRLLHPQTPRRLDTPCASACALTASRLMSRVQVIPTALRTSPWNPPAYRIRQSCAKYRDRDPCRLPRYGSTPWSGSPDSKCLAATTGPSPHCLHGRQVIAQGPMHTEQRCLQSNPSVSCNHCTTTTARPALPIALRPRPTK